MFRISGLTFIVFLTGMLGIWKAVPVGVAFGESPLIIWLSTSLGAIVAAFILYFFGQQIREYLARKKRSEGKKKKNQRARYLFDKYGTAGLGFLGCLVIGPNMTMLIGLILVSSPKKLLMWTIAGILVWTLALTLIAIFSVDLFNKLVS